MLRIEDIRVELGGRPVLGGASIEVRPGETVAVMGASGSGKSTLLRAAVGLIPVEGGRVWIEGEPVIGATPARLREIRRKVGMLFQGNALFDSMTVAENIGFVLTEVRGLAPEMVSERVDSLLDRLHLGPIGKSYPSELSGGMKKRVGIARAVAHDPRLVLYDDPTAGLDPVTSDVIAELIAELGQRVEQAAIIASNYLPLVSRAASRVTLVHAGRVIDLGPPGKIWESDRPELLEFLESGPGAKA